MAQPNVAQVALKHAMAAYGPFLRRVLKVAMRALAPPQPSRALRAQSNVLAIP